MSSVKLIISDLHLADGHTILDSFGHAQQVALQGLLEAANSARLLGHATDDVELIINGDCFDFLVIPPFQTDDTTDPATACEKLEKVIAAHPPFFEVLHTFISTPGRSVTFLTGNHDIELCFEEVRSRIAEAIYGQPVIDGQIIDGQPVILRCAQDLSHGGTQPLRFTRNDKWSSEGDRVHFCPSRFYRPVPNVYIEHGNQYDFWNHMSGIWDDKGQPLILSPARIPLPVGSQYVLRVGHPISLAYPYFDHFEPSLNILRQIALLSLFDPDLTRETAERLMGMLSYHRQALADLAPGDERIPARLFEHAMLDFLAFQQDVESCSPAWTANLNTRSTEVGRQESSANVEHNEDAMMEFLTLRDALTLPPVEAIAAICTPVVYSMGKDVARGMQHVLRRGHIYGAPVHVRGAINVAPTSYAIAGHSHMWRVDPIDNGRQTYLNTGTWTKRIALPTPDVMSPVLLEWLRQPDWSTIPLQDRTQFTFGMIATQGNGPSHVRLCAWEGGTNGNYRTIG